MQESWLAKRLPCFFLILLAVVAAGCTGNPGEEATVQAVVEQVISTNTPTPLPATPTETPTHTAVPPTDTPVPPTDTPVPPTPTASSAPLLAVEDEEGDTTICDTGERVGDPEVDIAAVQAAYEENSLLMRVLLSSPLESDFSFSVLVALLAGENISAYIWEIHDTQYRIGEVDYQTGELVAETGENLAIEHDLNAGEVKFTVPYTLTITTTTTVTTTTTISTTVPQVYVASFHTPEEGMAKHCDTAGPYTLPGGAQ